MIRDNDCAISWASLTRTGKARHCNGCGRLVHNWMALSPDEQARIQQLEADPCWLLPTTTQEHTRQVKS